MDTNIQTTTAAPLTTTGAGEEIEKLKAALAVAEEVAKVLLADPHFRNCPLVAAIRGPVVTAVERIEHLVGWFENNPVKGS
ncbi:MAG TPA: hypothetical protein VGN23_07520 [Verrucomicrobiae bacterium]|jgi:hypothetical protein